METAYGYRIEDVLRPRCHLAEKARQEMECGYGAEDLDSNPGLLPW